MNQEPLPQLNAAHWILLEQIGLPIAGANADRLKNITSLDVLRVVQVLSQPVAESLKQAQSGQFDEAAIRRAENMTIEELTALAERCVKHLLAGTTSSPVQTTPKID